jgi:hypothetical protein
MGMTGGLPAIYRYISGFAGFVVDGRSPLDEKKQGAADLFSFVKRGSSVKIGGGGVAGRG